MRIAILTFEGFNELDSFIASKRETAQAYATALAKLGGATPLGEAPWAFSNYWLFSTLLDPARWGVAAKLIAAARADGVECRPLWYPLHRQPVFADAQSYRIEVGRPARGGCRCRRPRSRGRRSACRDPHSRAGTGGVSALSLGRASVGSVTADIGFPRESCTS